MAQLQSPRDSRGHNCPKLSQMQRIAVISSNSEDGPPGAEHWYRLSPAVGLSVLLNG